MDARPLLEILAKGLNEVRLDAILIGNAAAALHGAPVTTIDFDFYFRKTPRNLQKLKALAKNLEAVLMRPYYPASELFRLVREDDGLQADFMGTIDGVRSFESLRAESEEIRLGGNSLRVANLSSVILSKRAAGRPRDKAVLDILRKTLDEKEGRTKKSADPKEKLAALKAESDRALVEMIRALLDKPMEQRTHFLRKRVGFGASCL